MAEYRHHIRVDCEKRCILQMRDLYYLVTVKNFSLGGALVNFYFPVQDLHVGDNCSISVGEGSFRKYFCEVVRVDTPKIALKFIDMDIHCTVEH